MLTILTAKNKLLTRLKRSRLNTHGVRIERQSDLGPWRIITRPTNNPDARVEALRCNKLIVSTGHETVPNFPSDLDLSKFTGTVFRSK
jgi:cation diffusion facilitator CzcD-associated flavoprotein CzcO